MNPQADALRQAGFAALRAGNLDEAIKLLQQSIGADPDSFDSCAYLGAAYAQKGNHESSRRMFGRCVQINPTSAKARFNLGKAHQMAGDIDAARTCYEAALEIEPGYTNASDALNALPKKVVSMADLASPGAIHIAGAHTEQDAEAEPPVEPKPEEPKRPLTPAEIARLSMPEGHLHMMGAQSGEDGDQ